MSCCTCSRLLAWISDLFTSVLKLHGDILFVLNCSHEIDKVSYCLHQLYGALVRVLKDHLCSGLVPVVLVFFWFSSVVEPVSILVIFIPVLESIISLVVPCILLVTSVSIVIPIVVLTILVVLIIARVSAIGSEIWSRIVWWIVWTALLEDLSKDLLNDPSADLFIDLVLKAFMLQSWKESSSSLICVSIFMVFWSLYFPAAASTKEDSLLISVACLNALPRVLIYEFFFAIYLSSFSLVFCGSFLAYSTIAVLSFCSQGDKPNATRQIASYLELNETSSSFSGICMLCSLAAASAVLGMSE